MKKIFRNKKHQFMKASHDDNYWRVIAAQQNYYHKKEQQKAAFVFWFTITVLSFFVVGVLSV